MKRTISATIFLLALVALAGCDRPAEPTTARPAPAPTPTGAYDLYHSNATDAAGRPKATAPDPAKDTRPSPAGRQVYRAFHASDLAKVVRDWGSNKAAEMPYRGKVVRVIGTVNEVVEYRAGYVLWLKGENPLHVVACEFEFKHKAALATLKPGRRVCVVGTSWSPAEDRMSLASAWLDDCELETDHPYGQGVTPP